MREQLTRILADTLGISACEIGDDSSMDTLPAWDSVAHLNLVMSIEQEFGVQFSPEELMEMRSLPAIEALLAKKRAA
jgi:acyl carrier protein